MNGLEIAGLCLLIVVGPLAGRWALAWRKQWAHAKHIAHGAPDPEPGELERDWYGSMNLDDERAWWINGVRQQGPPPRWEWYHPDWREQTAADLSPEALEPIAVWEREIRAESGLSPDSGPGVSSLAPGPDFPFPDMAPDYDPPPSMEFDGPWGRLHEGDGWLDAQLCDLFAWVRAQWEAAA